MIEYFQDNPSALWFSLGFALLIVEAVIFGFSSGALLFAGLGGVIAGTLMWMNLIPHTGLAGFVAFGLSSSVVAVLLWKPLKALQNTKPPEKDNSSDLIGYQFRLQEEITLMAPGSTRYSGIEWRVEIDNNCGASEIEAGALVKVSSVDAGLFCVTPVTLEDNVKKETS